MKQEIDHNCADWPNPCYENDSGWDTSYCPELPTHDVFATAETDALEIYRIGDGTILVYQKERKERIVSFDREEVAALDTVLPVE